MLMQMNEFADIHIHLLPGVDDGARDLQEACAMARLAYESGTRVMVLTPHFGGGYMETPQKF